MAKELCSLRLFMRSHSKKSVTDSSEGSSMMVPEPPLVSSATPQRQPLCPISDSDLNLLTPTQAEQSLPDSAATRATPKSKSDQPTPRAKAKLTFGGNEKYNHLENSERINRSLVNDTPEINALVNSRDKNRWDTHHSSSGLSGSLTSPPQVCHHAQQENITVDTASDLSTPSGGSKQSSPDNSQVSTGHGHQHVSKVQTLEASLEQAERKISEITRAVVAFEVAKDELEIERNRLMIASQEAAEICAQRQEEIYRLQSEVTEAEVREKVGLMVAKQKWEYEKDVTGQEIQDMKVEKEKLEVEMGQMIAKFLEKETLIYQCLEKRQETLDAARMQFSLLDEDLGDFEQLRSNLERDAADLEQTSSSTVKGLNQRGKEVNRLQLQLETFECQLKQAHDSFESLKAEIESERFRLVKEKDMVAEEKESLRQDYLTTHAELRERISVAESKFICSEEQLKSITRKLEELDSKRPEVELELAAVNEDGASAISNLKLREEELEELRARSHLLKSRHEEVEAKVLVLESLIQQYVKWEENWKSEKLRLVEKLKEVESMPVSLDQTAQGEDLECNILSASDKVPQVHIQRLKFQVENLERTIAVKDQTILSTKDEMEVATANLKEANLEIDKLQSEKDILKRTCHENALTILTLTLSLSRAEEEIYRKQLQVEAFEKEMLKVGEIVDDWEVKMLDVEKLWKMEKEELMKEIVSARLEAREKGLEAALLNQKFQETQVTLMETESVVNLLVRANERVKHTAQDLKLRILRESQEVWVQERDRLLEAVNCLRVEMDGRDQQVSLICEETAAEFSGILSIISSAQEEIALMRSKHEEEIQSLSDEMKNIRNHLLQGIPEWKELEIDTLRASSEQQHRRNVREVEVEKSFLSEQLDAAKVTVQLELTETEGLKANLVQLKEDFLKQENEAVLLRTKMMEFESKIQDLNQIIAQLSLEKNTAQERLSELETQMANTSANVQHLMEELEEGRFEAVNLELKLSERWGEGASEAQVGQLKTEVDELKSRLLVLDYSLTLAETELDDYLQRNKVLGLSEEIPSMNLYTRMI
ncbi:hypothetical protein R1sor_018332 [Riccia sorocarpa]|uniref:Uncharacterized protein n=1 Tax=Riccia sorocarpa TaxID=122646 RepID=A0ABD3ID40_9MARC